MGEDINVRDIRLLDSYRVSFKNFSSSIEGSMSSCFNNWGTPRDRLRNAVSEISHLTNSLKNKIQIISYRLEKAAARDIPAPSLVASLTEDLEKCKNAYARAKNYEEQSKKELNGILAQIEHVMHENQRLNSKWKNATRAGDLYLKNYIHSLKDYIK